MTARKVDRPATEAAGSDAERLSCLRQIAVFWPEYKDVPETIRKLESAQAKPDGG